MSFKLSDTNEQEVVIKPGHEEEEPKELSTKPVWLRKVPKDLQGWTTCKDVQDKITDPCSMKDFDMDYLVACTNRGYKDSTEDHLYMFTLIDCGVNVFVLSKYLVKFPLYCKLMEPYLLKLEETYQLNVWRMMEEKQDSEDLESTLPWRMMQYAIGKDKQLKKQSRLQFLYSFALWGFVGKFLDATQVSKVLLETSKDLNSGFQLRYVSFGWHSSPLVKSGTFTCWALYKNKPYLYMMDLDNLKSFYHGVVACKTKRIHLPENMKEYAGDHSAFFKMFQ